MPRTNNNGSTPPLWLTTVLLGVMAMTCSIHPTADAFRPSRQWGLVSTKTQQQQHRHGVLNLASSSTCIDIIQSLRAGATDDDDDNDDDTNDDQGGEKIAQDEEDDDVDEDDVDDDEEDEEEEEEEDDDDEETLVVESPKDTAVGEYDEMLIPSPSMQMYSVIGVMLLSRKLDMFNPTVVRVGRYVWVHPITPLPCHFGNYSLFTNTRTTTHSLSSHTQTLSDSSTLPM